MKTPLLLALALLGFVLPAHAIRAPRHSAPAPAPQAPGVPGPDDRVIDTTQRVGAVTHTSTEEDIVRVYGSSNVVVSKDGTYAVIFLGKPDEVRVDFRQPHLYPERVSIGGTGGAWTTANGLRVGVTVKDLKEINGGPFDVTGLNYQIPMRVVSWKGGALPPTLFVDLAPTDKLDAGAKKALGNNKTFYDSSDPLLQDWVVHRIIVEW